MDYRPFLPSPAAGVGWKQGPECGKKSEAALRQQGGYFRNLEIGHIIHLSISIRLPSVFLYGAGWNMLV
jgi:hypothetical protein